MEIELKLLIGAKHVRALRAHPLLKRYAVAPPHQLNMTDTYFDTTDLLLHSLQAGLRVRCIDQHFVQTFKSGGSVAGGLHQREEWESPVPTATPDLSILQHQAGRKTWWGRQLHAIARKEKLLPVFQSKVKRTVWMLRLAAGEEIECVLDLGQLGNGTHTTTIREIELELKSGKPDQLFDLALALAADIPLQIGGLSKAERGYALCAPSTPAAVTAKRLDLNVQMPLQAVFQQITANCLEQVQINAAVLAAIAEQESLHQMRVGLRRLKSALSVFEAVYAVPDDLQTEMDWLAAQLGMARDWDVLAYATLPMVMKKLPAAGFLGGIADVIEAQAESLRHTLSVLIESPRYTRLMLYFSRWQLAFPDQLQQAVKTQPGSKFSSEIYSRRMLKKYHHRLQVRGARFAGKNPDPRAAHRLRIASKKMRYATEFFLSFYPPKKLGHELPHLLRLQDQLGMHNDLIVAAKLLDTLRQTHVSFSGSIDFLQGYLAACASGREKKMRKLWKNFKPMKFFL